MGFSNLRQSSSQRMYLLQDCKACLETYDSLMNRLTSILSLNDLRQSSFQSQPTFLAQPLFSRMLKRSLILFINRLNNVILSSYTDTSHCVSLAKWWDRAVITFADLCEVIAPGLCHPLMNRCYYRVQCLISIVFIKSMHLVLMYERVHLLDTYTFDLFGSEFIDVM